MNDELLIAAVGAGDHVALKELFERHAPWVASRLRRVLPAHAVEDVVQETFIAVWRGAAGYRGQSDVGGWIWGIARRQAALWARKHNREAPVLPVSDIDDPATTAALRVDIEQAIAGLDNAEQRRLARLVFVRDKSTAEIARALGVPPGTVKSRVFKLRRRLQAVLGRDDL